MHLLILDYADTGSKSVVQILDAADITFKYEIATSPIASQQMLQERKYDVLLLDCHTPDLQVSQILARLQHTNPEIPLILVAQTLNDKVALELTQIGVADYVLQDSLFRLPTVLRRVLQEVGHSDRRFRSLIENATDLVLVIDANGDYRYLSPSAGRILGYTPETIVGQNIFDVVHPEDTALFEQKLKQSLQKSEDVSQPACEYRLRHHNGSWCYFEAVFTNLLNDLSVQGVVVNCHNITRYKHIEKQLRYSAFHDELTGLANRALFLDRLEQSLKRAKRQREGLLAVLFLDLDRFKTINDSLGHLAGDQLLVAIAQRIASCLHPGDTAARLGGDEFAILLEDIADVNEAIALAEQIHQGLVPPITLDKLEVFITVSIGIACNSRPYTKPDHLLRDADTAMYVAKEQGRGCHQVFTPIMHTRALMQLQLESDLRRAIALTSQREDDSPQEFQVYYQPIMTLADNHLVGFEALVRWQHPQQGKILPDQFIPIAEEAGLIIPIDHWVMYQACKQTRLWQQQFPSFAGLKVSVNLSGKQFQQLGLIAKIDQTLAATQLEPKYLKLEITESVIIQNAEAAVVALQQMRDRSISVCIDDFGTGYSSLSYLHRFPIDKLKIDRYFISQLINESENYEIVKTIVNLGLNLGMSVIAEGIETETQLAKLKSLGCQHGQGFYFSPPLDHAAATAWIKKLAHQL